MKMKVTFTESVGNIVLQQQIINASIAPFDTGVGAIQAAIGLNKGDLVVFNGTGWIRRGVGADGQALVADSSEASGLNWGAAGAFSLLTNKDSVELNAGDVVVHDFDNDSAFEGTTTEGAGTVAGVLGETIGVNQQGAVYSYAGTLVTVNCNSEAVSRGDTLITSTTKGKAKAGVNKNIFAVAITGKAAGASGTVTAMLLPVAGKKQARPEILLLDNLTAVEVKDGISDISFVVPAWMHGWKLIAAHAHISTVSSSGDPTFQIYNVTDSVDLLSTRITIDANEKDSITATTAAVIDSTKNTVEAGDELRFDCDVAGTGAKGLAIMLTFEEA